MTNYNLILHACCAPCNSYVYEQLKPTYNISVYFYNPNIAPYSEYQKRLKEIETFCKMNGLCLYCGNYDVRTWTRLVKQYRFAGERTERCWKCFEVRLRETFEFAKSQKAKYVTTTLSVSPYKDAEEINRIGKKLEQDYDITFIESDFKKNDGYKKSVQLSKEYGFYRQNYCGCIYSKMERDKNSLWYSRIVKKD